MSPPKPLSNSLFCYAKYLTSTYLPTYFYLFFMPSLVTRLSITCLLWPCLSRYALYARLIHFFISETVCRSRLLSYCRVCDLFQFTRFSKLGTYLPIPTVMQVFAQFLFRSMHRVQVNALQRRRLGVYHLLHYSSVLYTS